MYIVHSLAGAFDYHIVHCIFGTNATIARKSIYELDIFELTKLEHAVTYSRGHQMFT